MISLRWNTGANFFGLIYTTIIGIVILPLYLFHLGGDAFGLIGLFLMLQTWLQIFDLGISPLFSREAARARAAQNDYLRLKHLLRSFEIIILSISTLLFIAIFTTRNWISNHWLQAGNLDTHTISICLILMASAVCLRLPTTLYKSGLQGLERQVILNISNITIVSLKFIGGWLLVKYITQDIVDFFVYQLLIGVIETICVAILCYKCIPVSSRTSLSIYWSELQPVLPFASGLAYLATIWVILSQVDKFILSSILSLTEFGYFTLATILAAGISQLGTPISQAILPRMTYLISNNESVQMITLYRQSTRAMACLIVPCTGMIAFYSHEFVFIWTGNLDTAEWIGPILLWISLGHGIMALGAFQYYLQYAYGKLRMHVIFSSFMASIQIPLLIYTAHNYGVYEMSYCWFALRLFSFLLWTPVVHHFYAPGIHLRWFFSDIGISVSITTIYLFILSLTDLPLDYLNRTNLFLLLTSIGAPLLAINAFILLKVHTTPSIAVSRGRNF